MSQGWTPILVADVAARARSIVDVIARALIAPPPVYGGERPDDAAAVSLFAREPGFALFFAYLARVTGESMWEAVARAHLDTAIAALGPAVAEGRPYFAYGFAGLAWTLEHLDGWIVELEDDGLDDIDAAIATLLDSDAVSEIGLRTGLVGYAIYARERIPRRRATTCLQRIADRLVAAAEKTPEGIAWRTPAHALMAHVRAAHPDGLHALGVLEGGAGAAAILAGCRHAAAADAVRWLWAQADDHGRIPSIAGGVVTPTCWGTGDAGIAVTLAACGDHGDRAIALGRAVAADDRRVASEDASIVSGTSGIAHAMNRLFQRTRDPVFAAAARRWFERTIAKFDPARGYGGFAFWSDPSQRDYIPDVPVGWIDQPGLARGVAGVGLTLLAAISEVTPAWDRALLMSTKESA